MESEIIRTVDFISKIPLSYPNYDNWVQRAEAELLQGYKQTILAFSDKRIVGDLIYQPHKQIQGVLELKNMRIDERLRRRDFGHFMLRQAETEARKLGYLAMLIDIRPNRQDVIAFLMFSGFFQINRIPLYDSNEEDIVMMKPLLEDNKLVQKVKAFFDNQIPRN